jgi:hypothetical protein
MTLPAGYSIPPSVGVGADQRGRSTSLGGPRRYSMRAPQITVIGFLGLLAVLPVGCSRMTAVEQVELRQSFGLPADMPLKSLGAVKLRVGIPKRVSVGQGKACTITATVLANGSVQFNLLYESRGEIIDGVKTKPYSERSQVVLPPALLARAMKSKSWLCFPPMRPRFVVAMQPAIIP